MELFYIIIGVWLLYSRTWLGKNRHYHIIDDNVRRWGYLYDIPQTSPPPSFYSSKPHPWRHFFLILTHCLNIWVIDLLWGWQVAALFAFSPISVNGTAWITGGYYAVTMFLTLTAWYFVTQFTGLFGLITGSMFFAAALGSTITCIGIPLLFIFAGPLNGLILFWPLGMYIFGKRFRTGLTIRNTGNKDKITFRKLAVMTKVMAYYLRINLYPNKLAFFREYGRKYNKNPAVTKDLESFGLKFWLAVLVIASFAFVGWQFSPLGVLWFLVTLAPFTQFKILGQFVAERYLYLPQLGIYLILGSMLSPHPVLLAIVLTLYAYRSHLYIPAFRKIESLYKNGIANYPDCVSNFANLGERYLHVGQTHRSRRLLEEGLKLSPTSFLCHTNLAAYWISVRHWKKALYHTNIAVHDPGNPIARRVLGKQFEELTNCIEKGKKKELEKNVEPVHKREEPSKEPDSVVPVEMPVPALSEQPAV